MWPTVCGLTRCSAVWKRRTPSLRYRRLHQLCPWTRPARDAAERAQICEIGIAIPVRNAPRNRSRCRVERLHLFSALAASREVMRASMEYPTILPAKKSLIAHKYSVPSAVRCSMISVNHSWFGRSALKSRCTRSSCTAGPGRVLLPRAFCLPKTLNHWLSWQIRHAVRSAMASPEALVSSTSKRCPNSDPLGGHQRSHWPDTQPPAPPQPAIIRLASKLQDPARYHHGDSVDGELSYQRAEPFIGRCACDKDAAARRSASFSCSNSRLRSRSSFNSSCSDVVTPGWSPASVRA